MKRSSGGAVLIEAGGGGLKGETTPEDRLGDQFEVETQGAAQRDVRIEWTTGGRFVLPASSAAAIELGTLTVETVADPTREISDDNPNKVTTAPLYFDHRQAAFPARMTGSLALAAVRGTLTGGPRPTFSLSSLPRGTVSVDFESTPPQGVRVFTVTDGCGTDAQSQRIAVSGQFRDGGTYGFRLPSAGFVICHGREREVD